MWPFYELFLLGADCTKNPAVAGAKFTYVRDSSGKIMNNLSPEWNEDTIGDKHWSISTKDYEKFCKETDDMNYEESELLWAEKKLPKYVLVEKPSPRIFEYNGEIWHHLGHNLRQEEILKAKDQWAKSTVSAYRNALSKELHLMQKEAMSFLSPSARKRKVSVYSQKIGARFSSKDHLECFIEKL